MLQDKIFIDRGFRRETQIHATIHKYKRNSLLRSVLNWTMCRVTRGILYSPYLCESPTASSELEPQTLLSSAVEYCSRDSAARSAAPHTCSSHCSTASWYICSSEKLSSRSPCVYANFVVTFPMMKIANAQILHTRKLICRINDFILSYSHKTHSLSN